MVFLTFISKAFKQQWNFLFKDAVFWQQKVCLPGACCPWSLSIPAGCWSPFSGSPAACEAAAPPRSYSPAPLWTVPAAPPGCRSEATWQVDQWHESMFGLKNVFGIGTAETEHKATSFSFLSRASLSVCSWASSADCLLSVMDACCFFCSACNEHRNRNSWENKMCSYLQTAEKMWRNWNRFWEDLCTCCTSYPAAGILLALWANSMH